MQQSSTSKATSLILALWFIMQGAWATFHHSSFTLHHSPFIGVLMHAGIFHALCNAWCLLTIVFYYGCTTRRLISAYLVALSTLYLLSLLEIPSYPTLGFSGALFFLLGLMSFEVKRKLYWQAYLWTSIAIGFFIPNIAVGIHALCFALGILISFLNYPFIKS